MFLSVNIGRIRLSRDRRRQRLMLVVGITLVYGMVRKDNGGNCEWLFGYRVLCVATVN